MPPKAKAIKDDKRKSTNGDGPTIEELPDESPENVPMSVTEPRLSKLPMDPEGLELAILTVNEPVPTNVADAGFKLAEAPTCDTEYYIDGEEVQVLSVRLKRYQEMCFAKFQDLTHRDPRVQISKIQFGMRLKNMTGEGGVAVHFTPGYIAKIVPISLAEHPELICRPEAFLAATDAGLRIEDELRPGFVPYKALQGQGIVFLKSVGTALFHVLKDNEEFIANTPNVIAFQTFCKIADRAVEHPDKPGCCGGRRPPVFPHMKVRGPGLVMLSPLYPDSKVVPVSLDDHPDLYIKDEVFMAASNSSIDIIAERLKKNLKSGQTHQGEMFFCMHGNGMLFLNVTGNVVKYQKLQPSQTILTSTSCLVAFEGSCKVVQEKVLPSDSQFLSVKVSGPGLVIIQSLSCLGRQPERWGIAKMLEPKMVKKSKQDAELTKQSSRNSITPTKPQPVVAVQGLGNSYQKQDLETE